MMMHGSHLAACSMLWCVWLCGCTDVSRLTESCREGILKGKSGNLGTLAWDFKSLELLGWSAPIRVVVPWITGVQKSPKALSQGNKYANNYRPYSGPSTHCYRIYRIMSIYALNFRCSEHESDSI